LILHYTQYGSLIAGVFFTPILLVLFFAFLVIFFVIRFFKQMVEDGQRVEQLITAPLIGGLFLFVFPLAMAASTACTPLLPHFYKSR
jgi:hypothetical protein